MKYVVHRRGAYYHATIYFDKNHPTFSGLYLITPRWDPLNLVLSSAIDKYSTWSVRAYRWRIKQGIKSWNEIRNIFTKILEWSEDKELQYAMEFSFARRQISINCEWGASTRRPGGKKRYDAREDEIEKMIIELLGNMEKKSAFFSTDA